MQVLTIPNGAMQVNTYIVYADGEKSAVVIDPSHDADVIIDELNSRGLMPTHVLLTHGHPDHISATDEIKAAFDTVVAVHEADGERVAHGAGNMTLPGYRTQLAQPADVLLKDGDTIEAAGLAIEVMHTPGHSPGSVCYIADDVLLAGDTLFAGGIGRTDFEGGDWDAMQNSLRRLMRMERDYTVYPGHGPATRLSIEKQSNPFMRI